jgi:hypothetical protein
MLHLPHSTRIGQAVELTASTNLWSANGGFSLEAVFVAAETTLSSGATVRLISFIANLVVSVLF